MLLVQVAADLCCCHWHTMAVATALQGHSVRCAACWPRAVPLLYALCKAALALLGKLA